MNKHRVFLAWALACGLGAQPAFAADNPPAAKAGAAVEAVPPRPAADAAGNPMDSVIGGYPRSTARAPSCRAKSWSILST